jgi:DNA-binding GntR family transcriptional regulator
MPEPIMAFKANDSLTEQIARYLEQRIIQGEMPPGERIQELRIAAELEVSRGSVREALLILQRRHLVEIYPRRGAVVTSISPQDVRDFFDLWLMLLERAASDLCLSWKEKDLAALSVLAARMGECQENQDWKGFYQQAMAFLQQLYDCTRNRYLADTLNDLFPQTQRSLYAIMRAGQAQIPQTHAFFENLVSAMRARKPGQIHQMIAAFGGNYSLLAQEAAEALDDTAGM